MGIIWLELEYGLYRIFFLLELYNDLFKFGMCLLWFCVLFCGNILLKYIGFFLVIFWFLLFFWSLVCFFIGMFFVLFFDWFSFLFEMCWFKFLFLLKIGGDIMLIWGYIKFFNIFLGFSELMEEIEENGIL